MNDHEVKTEGGKLLLTFAGDVPRKGDIFTYKQDVYDVIRVEWQPAGPKLQAVVFAKPCA